MREIELSNYLPDTLKEIKEFKEIMNAEAPELQNILMNMEMIVNNAYIDSLNAYGCDRWENMLGIKAKASDTTEARKFKIKAVLTRNKPYTLNKLREILKSICGDGNFSAYYGDEAYTLNVGLALKAKDQYNYINSILKKIVPANIFLKTRVLYNTHAQIRAKPMTYEAMRKYSHKGLSEEEI